MYDMENNGVTRRTPQQTLPSRNSCGVTMVSVVPLRLSHPIRTSQNVHTSDGGAGLKNGCERTQRMQILIPRGAPFQQTHPYKEENSGQTVSGVSLSTLLGNQRGSNTCAFHHPLVLECHQILTRSVKKPNHQQFSTHHFYFFRRNHRLDEG